MLGFSFECIMIAQSLQEVFIIFYKLFFFSSFMYPRMFAYLKSSLCARQANSKLLRLTWSDKWLWNTWESSSEFFGETKKSLTFLHFNECQLFIITYRTTTIATTTTVIVKCRNLCQTNYIFCFYFTTFTTN